MRDIFKYEKRGYYPHMNTRDQIIWEQFLQQYPDKFEAVQYDFHIGNGPGFNTLLDDGTDLNQDMLYRKRIDVVGLTPTQNFIIELKPNAGMPAVGQVKGYKMLYDEEKWTDKRTIAAIITDAMSDDVQRYCRKEGVLYFIV